MKKHEIRVNSRGGLRRKGWWDEEVQRALIARRTANRLHRAAVRTSPGEECMSTWEEYLRFKREMRILVQSKIARYNSKQLRAITEAGRNGANKFWKYVSSLDRQTPAPEIRHHSSNLPVTDLAAHLTTMQELFNPTHDESTSAVNSDPDEPHQPSEEDHWQITRIALERALPRISASTATGLDGIPAGLVKCLGKSAREHLAGIFNTILKNGPIPPDWQCGRVSLVCKRGGDAGLLGDYRPITALVESGVGFAFRLMIGGVAQTWTLPGLVFADDLVLLAERSSDLQRVKCRSTSKRRSTGSTREASRGRY
ncbi:hypothetical protein MRX96_023015 [Rhipicephalus microplus]